MKWWLIIYVITPHGVTAFDLEYSSRSECTDALVKTVEIRKEYTDDEHKVLRCSTYPMPLRQLKNPELKV